MVWVLLFLSALSPRPASAKRPLVLLTAFGPFGGRGANGSQNVAKEIERLYAKDGVDYKICILPVTYDGGAEAAKKCYEEMKTKPDFVLSTGEGGCDVRVESRANNLDDTPGFPDNAGVERKNHVIDADAPEHEPLGLPVPVMVCSAPKGGLSVVPSISPGYYVCNATAYRLARYFNPRHIPFGFVHLPTASCKAKPADTALLLHNMVKAAWSVLAPAGRRPLAPSQERRSDRLACESSVRGELADKLRKWPGLKRQRGGIAPQPRPAR